MLSEKIKWKEFQKSLFISVVIVLCASKIVQDEPAIKKSKYKLSKTPIAKKFKKNIINFCTNQGSIKDANRQVLALKKTIKFFDNSWHEKN